MQKSAHTTRAISHQSESSSQPGHERAELAEPLDPSEFALLFRPIVLRRPPAAPRAYTLATGAKPGVVRGVAGEEATELPRDDASELRLESATLPMDSGAGGLSCPTTLAEGSGVLRRTAHCLVEVLGVPPTDFESPQLGAAGVAGDAMGVELAEELEAEESQSLVLPEELECLLTSHPTEPLAAADLHARFDGAGEGERNLVSSNVSSGLRTLFQKCAWILRVSSIAARYIAPAAAGGDDGAELEPSVPGRLSSLEGSSSACTHAAMLCAVARKL